VPYDRLLGRSTRHSPDTFCTRVCLHDAPALFSKKPWSLAHGTVFTHDPSSCNPYSIQLSRYSRDILFVRAKVGIRGLKPQAHLTTGSNRVACGGVKSDTVIGTSQYSPLTGEEGEIFETKDALWYLVSMQNNTPEPMDASKQFCPIPHAPTKHHHQ
jgi:hypothetical protein